MDDLNGSGYAGAMEQLVEAVQRLSLARDLGTVMEIVRKAARRLTGADGATFVLRDGDKCFYAEEDAISPLWKGQRFPIDLCISGWTMLNRKPATIEDIYADPRIPSNAYRPTFVKSLAMVPIRTLDPIGAIGNYWAAPHLPTPGEVRILQALADTTAVAMENVRVYGELEQRVRHRTSELEAILDNVQVGIAFSVDGRIVRANPKSAEILGLASPEVMLNQSLSALLHPPGGSEPVAEEARERLDEGQVFDAEIPLVRADGSGFWGHLVAKSLDSGSEIWVIDDITEAKNKEKMLTGLRMAAEESTRFKSEFLASMSHELRTPLNAIIGFSEILRDGLAGELQGKQHEYVNDIFESGLHLLALINDVLDLSKIEAGKMAIEGELTDVSMLLHNSLSIVREKAMASRIRLHAEVPASLDPAWLDPRKCKQIVFNLLSNAVKFTPEGGEVTVHCRLVGQEEAKSRAGAHAQIHPSLESLKADQLLEISVADTGIGISGPDMDRLFQPFVQIDSSLSRKFEGTGLGLALVRKLAELHGGAVALRSTPGQGSTFTVWLPYHDTVPQAAVRDQNPVSPVAPLGKDKRASVLVVEDDDRAADLIRVQLDTLPCEVRRVGTAEAALVLLEDTRPDLIILDILLPGMDGWEFLVRLRERKQFSSIPVVILSIVADTERGLSLGAAEVLQKPVSSRELGDALTHLGLARKAESAPFTRALVVDDDLQAGDIVASYLKTMNVEVLRAYNGTEALALARISPPDLVVLDLMMPEMNGFEVVEELKRDKRTALVPIVVLTSRTLTSDDRKRLNGHALEVMEKSRFSLNRFKSEVARALGRKGSKARG